MSEGNSPQVWRVECDDGVREVTLLRNGHGSLVVRAPMHVEMVYSPTAPERYAVSRYAGACGWPVVEIVAPGQPTRAELEARNVELVKERDAAVATEREEGGKLCDLCAQFARVMGDPHAEEYEKLAAAIRAGSRALLPLHVERGASPIDLDAIEARANAATAGPWEAPDQLLIPCVRGVSDHGNTIRVCQFGWNNSPDAKRRDANNAVFIAHAREDVPALVAEVRRLRGALAHLHRGEDR